VKPFLICLNAIAQREGLRFLSQRERFLAALVRPLVWLVVFAAGFRAALGLSIMPPYQTYITYEVYIVPGLCGMIQLFNGMQSSLSLVYDREMGSMRLLLTSPLPLIGYVMALPMLLISGLMLGSLGLLLSAKIKQLENFAGVMNFVIFPMFFMSTALYPLWKMAESSEILRNICAFNPFSHAIEAIRFALYGQINLMAIAVVVSTGVVFFTASSWYYDPARGITKRKAG